MSFMPSLGVRVRLTDNRVATVSRVTPDGSDDRVRLDDGHEERVDAWRIREVIGAEEFGVPPITRTECDMDRELPLPCPFCGGNAELDHVEHPPRVVDDLITKFFYRCDSCACCGGWGRSETSALKMWNTRTNAGAIGR